MENQTVKSSLGHSGYQYLHALKPAYERASLELSWLFDDPTAGPLLNFVFCWRKFHERLMMHVENPTNEIYEVLLHSAYKELDASYAYFEKIAKMNK